MILLANALRSGYSLLQSMETVSRELPPPMSVEFARVVREIGLGLTIEEALAFWQSDAEHLNTMVSDFRSDIGAAVAVSNQIYVVLETALSTPSRQHQNTAYDILTGIPMTRTLCAGFASGEISTYSIPMAVSTARPDGDVVHEVKYGQTLWSLADLYHVNVEDIKRLNGLIDDTVVPGWKLLIQKGATQPAPPPPTFIFNTPDTTQTPHPT